MRRQGRQLDPEPEMPQWEYCEIPRKTKEIDLLNDASTNGWELVLITVNNVAYLKRRVAGPTAPSPSAPPGKTDAG